MRDVLDLALQVREERAYPALQRGRRIAFVAAAVEPDGRMVPDPQDRVADVAQEQVVVVGIGPIVGIREPEVLPDHDAVLVAGVVELVVSRLADPVADHGEVHVAMEAHGDVVLALAVAEIGLRKAPVAAAAHEASAVDPDPEGSPIFTVGELPHAGLERLRVGRLAVRHELEGDVVEVGIAVPVGPPEPRLVEAEGGVTRRIQDDRPGGVGRQLHGLLERDVAERSAKRAGDGLRLVVRERGRDRHVGAGGVGERQRGPDERILHGDRPGDAHVDVVPEADVPAAHRGDPVPADRGVVGGIVGAQRASVLPPSLDGLLLHAPGRRVLLDPHRQGVELPGLDQAGHVEPAAHEAALDTPHLLAVQVDLGLPVHAVEIQEAPLPRRCGLGLELGPIPEVRIEEGVGDRQLVLAEVGVRQCAGVPVAREDGAWHRRDHPVGVLEAGLREGDAIGVDQGVALHAPPAARQIEPAVASRRRGRMGLRDQSAAAPDLHLAERVSLGRGGARHQDADVASLGGLRELDVVGRPVARGYGLDVAPGLAIVRGLDRALSRAPDPREADAVEDAGRADVHGHPLRARALRHPGARETIGPAHLDLLVPVEEAHLGEGPAFSGRRVQGHPVEARVLRRRERDCGPEHGIRPAKPGEDLAHVPARRRRRRGLELARDPSQRRPRLPVIRRGDGPAPLLRLGPRVLDRLARLVALPRRRPARVCLDLDAVDLKRRRSPAQLELDPARAPEVDAARRIVVEGELARWLGSEAAIARRGRDPARRLLLLDPVGHELGRQVVVVGARLEGGTSVREVAIGRGVRNEGGGEVLTRVAGIDPHALRLDLVVTLRGHRPPSRETQQENRCCRHAEIDLHRCPPAGRSRRGH